MGTDEKRILEMAIIELDKLKEEMNRPEEDVVSFSVCYSARKSIADFLSFYLTINNVDTSGANNLEDMLQLCIGLDDKFMDLDLSELVCFSDDISSSKAHCMELEQLNHCVETVEKTKDLVHQLSQIKRDEN